MLPTGRRSNLLDVTNSCPFSSRAITGNCLFRGKNDLSMTIADLVKGNYSRQIQYWPLFGRRSVFLDRDHHTGGDMFWPLVCLICFFCVMDAEVNPLTTMGRQPRSTQQGTCSDFSDPGRTRRVDGQHPWWNSQLSCEVVAQEGGNVPGTVQNAPEVNQAASVGIEGKIPEALHRPNPEARSIKLPSKPG